MTDPRWDSLVAEVVGEFATDELTAGNLIRRLRDSGDWEIALAQFRGGASERRVRSMIQRPLIIWCGKNV